MWNFDLQNNAEAKGIARLEIVRLNDHTNDSC